MIVVTGGAGFIGSHLVDALVARGEAVRVVDDFSSGRRENLAAVERRIELVRASIVDPDAVARALEGAETVFHLAACPSVQRSFDEPQFCHAVNATGTLAVIVAAGRAKTRRLVFASSCSVYGDAGREPAAEVRPPAPKSPYAAQKLLGEHYLLQYGGALGIETVALRFFNVYGPRQDPDSPYSGVISIFCERLLRGEPVTFHGDGGQARDFIEVGDVVQALLAAAVSPAAAGRTINVATGVSRTLIELHETLARNVPAVAPPRHGPSRAGDIRHSAADVSLARALLPGAVPRVGFAEGLARTLDWQRRRLAAPTQDARV